MVALRLLYPNYSVSKFGDVDLGSLIKSISLHVQKIFTQAWWIRPNKERRLASLKKELVLAVGLYKRTCDTS